jgi:hypothetical protein
MSLQYLSDEKGQIVAVQVPIKEWELLKSRYPEIDDVANEPLESNADLPDWQKELIDYRLDAISRNPERILPIDSLMAELDRNQE